MVVSCESRDKELDDFFNDIPEYCRPAVRELALKMSIDIMLSRNPMERDEWKQIQVMQSMTSTWPEVRRIIDGKVETWYVSKEYIHSAIGQINSFLEHLGIPSHAEGQLRYYAPKQSKDAKGGTIIKASDSRMLGQGCCYEED